MLGWVSNAAEANALFGMGYEIYALFLLMSTVGIPVAVAKQVSKYNTLGDPQKSTYLVRKNSSLYVGSGCVFCLYYVHWFTAFCFHEPRWPGIGTCFKKSDFSSFGFPAMSVLRGFFQGFNNLKPYALSQIAEQVIRVIWMLLTAFFIMKMGSGNYVDAVIQSTFALLLVCLPALLC